MDHAYADAVLGSGGIVQIHDGGGVEVGAGAGGRGALEVHAQDVLVEVDGFFYVGDYVEEVAYADDVAGRGGRGQGLGEGGYGGRDECGEEFGHIIRLSLSGDGLPVLH